MTRLFNPCRKCRENICALLSGDLSGGDRADVEKHLVTCADCRRYRNEIENVTALLGTRREIFRNVEPGETTRTRWATEFEAALEPRRSVATRVGPGFLDWTRDMIWPCRRIWAGLAGIWIVILGLNASQRADEKERASRAPSPEIMRALLAHEGFLPGLGRGGERSVGVPRQMEAPNPDIQAPEKLQPPRSKTDGVRNLELPLDVTSKSSSV